MFLLLSYLSFLASDVVSRSWGKPPFSFSFSFFSSIFPVFSFFATKKINGERDYVKSAYFPALSSCERFMRCMGTSGRFPAPFSLARSPVNARAWRDREVMTCQALVQSWFSFRVSNSQLSFSCVSEELFF